MIHIQPYMDILYHFMIHISELWAIIRRPQANKTLTDIETKTHEKNKINSHPYHLDSIYKHLVWTILAKGCKM